MFVPKTLKLHASISPLLLLCGASLHAAELYRDSCYPRWAKDGAAIVYHAERRLFLHTLADGSIKRVSTDPKADYRYPHGEATPN